MDIFLIRAAVVVIGCVAASYTDLKTGLIPDRITYPMMALGVLFNFIAFDEYALAVAAATFGVSYLFYHLGKLGGGDLKLFVGIALLLPMMNGFPFILSSVFFASVAAVIMLSTYYVGRYALRGVRWKENVYRMVHAGFLGAAVGFYLYILYGFRMVPLEYILLVAVTVFFGLLFMAFERGIKREFFLKKAGVKDLEEDELVAAEFLEPGTRAVLGMKWKGILGEREIRKLNDAGIKEIFVYRNLPKFAPFILAGVVLALAFPIFPLG